jgi:hypothetical protein
MVYILNDLIKTGELCGVYTDADNTNKFSVGYICGHDGNFFLLEKIDPYGQNDGISCQPIEKIFNLEIKTEYIKDIQKLFDFNKEKRRKAIKCGDDAVRALLKYANENGKICAIELYESGCDDLIGFVKRVKDGILSFDLVSERGMTDGETFAEISRISSISCDSSDEKKIAVLAKLNDIA